MSKNRQNRENIKAWKKKQKEEFLASLPFPEQKFQELFDYLDEKLENNICKKDFSFTRIFLKNQFIDFDKCIDFFVKHGAYCDCEVLMNIEELFPVSDNNETVVVQKAKEKIRLNKLIWSDFEIENVPKPWKLFRCDDKYKFQFGKKNEINVLLIESLNDIKWEDENFWKEQWEEITELNLKSGFEVIYDKFNKFDLVTLKSKSWIPVLTWIKPIENKNWGLLFKTESMRFQGDMNELKNLLKNIN